MISQAVSANSVVPEPFRGFDDNSKYVVKYDDRNRAYFPDFNADLSAHLMECLEGYERSRLPLAKTLKPGIDDWTITSLSGSYRDFGGSLATNNAALLDSVSSTVANTMN